MSALSSACFTHVQPVAKAFGLGAHDVAVQLVILGGARHILAHGLQRHGDHLPRQRLIDPRQPVEPEPADHRAKRRALHHQREQREPGGEDADHPLDVLGHPEALGHRQRQRQRHRAPQAAPEDRGPVGPLDRG